MTLNIVNLIENNPITHLSKPYQSKLLNNIKRYFTTDEQHMFVTSFYCYLNYSKNECIIDLDNVWQWMGFAKKSNAKQLVESNFSLNTDYKILSCPKSKQPSSATDRGGHNKKQVLITVATFKKMCMKANTSKAEEVREYFVKLEDILMELVNEQASELVDQLTIAQTQLELQKTYAESVEAALQFEKDKHAKYLNKRYCDVPPGDQVYALQCDQNDPNSGIKLGKTKDLRGRESDHQTSNNNCKIVYNRSCHDCDLLEKVLHHMTEKHRIHKNREWFAINKDVAKEIIDIAHLVLDDLIPICEHLAKHDVFKKFKAVIDELKLFENIPKPDVVEIPFKNKYDIQNEALDKLKDDAKKIDHIVVPTLKMVNPLDFASFIEERCEVDPAYSCLKVDLYGAHKLWSRNESASTKKAMFEYMSTHFGSSRLFFPEHNSVLATFTGVRPKPMTLPPCSSEIGTFIAERCKVGYTYRCNYKSIFGEFENWKRKELPDYVIDKATKKQLQTYLNIAFLPSHVYLKVSNLPDMPHNTSSHGVWGLTLNNDQSHTGLKISHSLKKKIIAIDVTTNLVVNTFNSGTEASKFFAVGASAISTDIKFNRIRNNCYLRFVNPDGELVGPAEDPRTVALKS